MSPHQPPSRPAAAERRGWTDEQPVEGTVTGDGTAPRAVPGLEDGPGAGEAAPADAVPEGPTLEAVSAERDQFLDALQRMKAEFDNYRKRTDRERQVAASRSTRDLVIELLPVMENLERAVDALNDEHDAALTAGVEMVRVQLKGVLSDRGVEEIAALGLAFDPTVHEAVLSQPTAEHAPGTVAEVVQKGYRQAEAVLRPARVVVAAALSDLAQ